MGDFEQVDVTVEAQKILSCIFRLKQRGFPLGKARVGMILTGSADKKLEEWGLTSLSTYGIMRGDDRSRVRDIMEFLEAEGYFTTDNDRRVCVLLPKADVFIKSGKRLVMRMSKRDIKKASVQPKKAIIRADAQHQNPELFERLRELRKNLASALGVPPYVVFADSALWSMCAILPKDHQEFLAVAGVGARKAERYGKIFMEEIDNYLRTRM